MTHPLPLTILQLSDLHIMPNRGEKMLGIDTEFYFQNVLKHAHSQGERYDLILVSGDLVQKPCKSSYQRVRDLLIPYQTECICLPGNHDDDVLMREILNVENISCNKQRLFSHWQLLCLNSRVSGQPGGYLAEAELAFLEAKLNSTPDLFTIVAVHHHCLPSRSDWLDTMIITNSASLFEVIKRYPRVKAITMGHIHQEIDVTVHSTRVLASPSTCFQFKPNCADFTLDTSMPGYRVIKLFPNGRLFTQVKRLPGKLTELDDQSPGY